MAVISDGRGGYIDTSTGAPVDAQGQPIVAGQVPGLPGYTRESLAGMLGIPANDPRMDQYMQGQTPQGAWSIQQIAKEVAAKNTADTTYGGNSGPVANSLRQPSAAPTTDQHILAAIQMLSGQGNQNSSAYGALAGSAPAMGGAYDPSKMSVGANQVINATQGGYDPYHYAAEHLNAGQTPEQVWSGLQQAGAMYGNASSWTGDLDLSKIQAISTAMGQHGITPIGPQPFGGGTPTPGTNPGTDATNQDKTNISNQIRNNWMNSPTHNPGGINTYAIQNMTQDDLTKGMAGGPSDNGNTYEQAGQNYDPTASGTGGNAFGGISVDFNNTANSGQLGKPAVAGQIAPGSPSVTETDTTYTGGNTGGSVNNTVTPAAPAAPNPMDYYAQGANGNTQPAPNMTGQSSINTGPYQTVRQPGYFQS